MFGRHFVDHRQNNTFKFIFLVRQLCILINQLCTRNSLTKRSEFIITTVR